MARWTRLLGDAPFSAKLGFAILLLATIAAVFAPILAPYRETEIVGKVWMRGFWAPDFATRQGNILLGTDQLGRDLLSRLLYGARNTIGIALATTILSFTIGVTTGFIAATLRGWVDQVLSRVVDIMMSFPTLIFALIVLSVVGISVPILIIVIALLDATRIFRISRAVAMDVEVMEFVEVAKLRGEGLWWVMRREILPNAVAPLVAEFGLRFCFVFLFIAALSFLGLGIQPPFGRLGQHGARERRRHLLRDYDAADPGGGDRGADHRREPRRRLGAAQVVRHSRGRMNKQLWPAPVSDKGVSRLLTIRFLVIEAYQEGSGGPSSTASRCISTGARCSASLASPAPASRPSASPPWVIPAPAAASCQGPSTSTISI